MEYRSMADLNAALFGNFSRLPARIDLVVGVPRSGLLVANLLSLAINVPMADLQGFIEGRILASGRTKNLRPRSAHEYENVLLVDDSLNSGRAMREAVERIGRSPYSGNLTSCAVYGLKPSHPSVDIILEALPQPRLFQWNFLHHAILESACFDIDGVLCCDPEQGDNDDSDRYLSFLSQARPYLRPTRRIGHLVTSRLERYRPQTEAWLAANDISYGKLWMLDLSSAAERRRLKAHASFKSRVYQESGALLFVESEPRQAREIALDSGKPVLCIETQDVVLPDTFDLKTAHHGFLAARRRRLLMTPTARWKARAKAIAKRLVGSLLTARSAG
jgi:uncharacterized HAD superfamily protein